jgi:hypothetical protein
MDVLVLDPDRDAGARAVAELEAAGHRVLRCESATGAPCVGLEVDGECPFDAHDVSVAVVATAGGALAPEEHGALCAARRRVPVVTTGLLPARGPIGQIARPAGAALVAAVERVASSGAAHAAAVTRSLVALGVVAPDEVIGPHPYLDVEVVREPRRLQLTLRLPDADPRTDGIVKSSIEALRRFDTEAPVIDCRVVPWTRDPVGSDTLQV